MTPARPLALTVHRATWLTKCELLELALKLLVQCEEFAPGETDHGLKAIEHARLELKFSRLKSNQPERKSTCPSASKTVNPLSRSMEASAPPPA